MSILIDDSREEQAKLIAATMAPISAVGLLKTARDILLAATPEATHGATVIMSAHDLQIGFHGLHSYGAATDVMRRFGVVTWETQMNPETGCNYIQSELDDFGIVVFFKGPIEPERKPGEPAPF